MKIVILTVVSDNFCGLAASSHSNCTDGMNSWAAESLPVVWMPGGMVRHHRLGKNHSWIFTNLVNCSVDSQTLLMQLSKTQHRDFEFSCLAFQ